MGELVNSLTHCIETLIPDALFHFTLKLNDKGTLAQFNNNLVR